MTTGPQARQIGLAHALEEFEEILAKRLDEVPDDLDDFIHTGGTEIAVFSGSGGDGLFVTEDPTGGYRFRINARGNEFRISAGEAVALAEAILRRTTERTAP